MTSLSLLGEGGAFVELPHALFEELVRQGKLTGVMRPGADEMSTIAKRFLAQASPEALRIANYRYEAIWPKLDGSRGDDDAIADRTARRWLARYRQAEERYGCGE